MPPKITEEEFNSTMTGVTDKFKSGKYVECAIDCDVALRSYAMSPEQAGWLINYRHRSWYFMNSPETFEKALSFLENGRGFANTIDCALWMVSTAAEMACELKRVDTMRLFLDRHADANAKVPDLVKRERNNLQRNLNAFSFYKRLGADSSGEPHLAEVIRILKEYPAAKDGIDVPDAILEYLNKSSPKS